MATYDRVNFYPLGEARNGDKVLDLTSADWNDFRKALVISRRHVVNQEEENDLPLIAWKQYGVIDLWWVIAQANNIINPLADVVVGMELELPTRESIDRELRQLQLANDKVRAATTVTLPRRDA